MKFRPASQGRREDIWSFWKTQLPNLNFSSKLCYICILSWTILLNISSIFLFTSDFRFWFSLVFIATPVVSQSAEVMFQDEDIFTEAGWISEIHQQAVSWLRWNEAKGKPNFIFSITFLAVRKDTTGQFQHMSLLLSQTPSPSLAFLLSPLEAGLITVSVRLFLFHS